MYYSISGKVIYCGEGRLVVECGGVGYDLAVSTSTLVKLGNIGQQVTVYTYLQVQEDALRLFGFYSREEKAMFENLLTVSGVGPKLAIQILSGQELGQLVTSIVNADVKAIASSKGVGKKTAERIVLELQGKLNADGALESILGGNATPVATSGDEITRDAVEALMSFGISRSQAEQAVAKVRGNADDLESVIALAFRSL
ncbi:MAG: Holliday junction branch migration protein RuvA [Clostridia bacterium]|nr:Holliday junction branch migration protein RuvA [Clostridia bacterium]MDY4083640.1 Holliday junction branch migration protein RuvA [Eubacteriales bacterium]